jgi:translocation and assembly module TamB
LNPPASPPPAHRHWRRLARALEICLALSLWLLGSATALLLALLLAAWLWSGQPQSLPRTLQWASAWLAGWDGEADALVVREAQGSLREGGRIGYLRWRHAGLEVELEGLELRWPASLWPDVVLRQQLQLDRLELERLRVSDRRAPQPASEPPADLQLPWLRSVRVPLQISALSVDSGVEFALGPLQARYRYEAAGLPAATARHQLEVSQLRWAQGDYRLQATLDARAPLRLDARLDGELRTTPPGGQPQALQAHASVSGPLGGRDATLQLAATIGAPPATDRLQPRGTALQAQATLAPWAELPLQSAELELHELDLATLWPRAPATRLQGRWRASHGPAGTRRWQLAGELSNGLAGPWDRGALPIERLRARLDYDGGQWRLDGLDAELAGGRLEAAGRLQLPPAAASAQGLAWWQRLGHWEGRLLARIAQPRSLLSSLALQPFELKADARSSGAAETATAFELTLSPAAAAAAGARDASALPAPHLQARGRWTSRVLEIAQADVGLLGASLHGHATWPLGGAAPVAALALELPGARGGVEQHARGGAARLDVDDASGLGRWLRDSVGQLDRLLPQLGLGEQIPHALRGVTLEGQAVLQTGWSGALRPDGHAPQQWSAELRLPQWRMNWPADSGMPPLQLKNWKATLDGQGPKVRLSQDGESGWPGWNASTMLRARGELAHDHLGSRAEIHLDAATLQAAGPTHALTARLPAEGGTRIDWQEGRSLTVTPGQLLLSLERRDGSGAGPAARAPARISWDAARWSQGLLESRGQASGLALNWIDALLASPAAPQGPLSQAGLSGEVLLQAGWELSLPLHTGPARPAATPRARLNLRRSSGDLTLLAGEGSNAQRIAIGLDEAGASLELNGSQLQGQLRWLSRNAGQIRADFGTRLSPPSSASPDWAWPEQSPMSGRVLASLPQIGLWSRLAPPGWRMRGSLQADITIDGSRAQPEWRGTLRAGDLALRSLLDGLEFSDGQLQASLSGETLTIDSLSLRGAGGQGGGLLLGSGSATWARGAAPTGGAAPRREPRIALKLQAQQLRLFARADRRLSLSGQLDARLQGNQLDLGGQLQVDQALILLPDESAPKLGEDVVVRGPSGSARPAAASPVQTRVQLELGLGDDFRLRGMGLDTYLKGRLQLSAQPGQGLPHVNGLVHTARGNYRAYGQRLEITEGQVNFNGPYDNPGLDILALRTIQQQRVGVQVTGTAQAPRVRLYADPDLPDNEKLAWLLLGRPASSAGAESMVLQQAALALLAGRGRSGESTLNRALGLDELSLYNEASKADGSGGATALRLGKRLSDQFYLSYSRSVIGLLGTVSVFYDVSRYLTLRAQAGDDNALDLIFTHKFDSGL